MAQIKEETFNEFEDDNWEDEDDNWGDDELIYDDTICSSLCNSKSNTTEEENKNVINIFRIVKCQSCKNEFFNSFICTNCGEIDTDELLYSQLDKQYSDSKILFAIINQEYNVNEALKKLYLIEINMFIKTTEDKIQNHDVCQCCFGDFKTECIRYDGAICHNDFCEECIENWINIKVKDNKVKPFIKCLKDGCDNPLSCESLIFYMNEKMKEKFLKLFAFKTLLKYKFFKQCKTHNCCRGIIFNPNEPSRDGGTGREIVKIESECIDCNQTYTYEYNDEQVDSGIKKMINKGMIRLCPSCSTLTTKRRTTCNVIKCINCDIYWNWETKVTGPTYGSVTNKKHWSKDSSNIAARYLYFED